MISSDIDVNSTAPELTELIDRATDSREIITLKSGDRKKAVLIGVEAFEYLVGLNKYRHSETMPADEFEQGFHQALVEAGYDSREKILNLVRDVKQELYEERQKQ